ncbi:MULTISPECIES: putative holin-like toxin [Veillonella]
MKGGDTMTVYEALSLMIAFATLVVLIISFKR